LEICSSAALHGQSIYLRFHHRTHSVRKPVEIYGLNPFKSAAVHEDDVVISQNKMQEGFIYKARGGKRSGGGTRMWQSRYSTLDLSFSGRINQAAVELCVQPVAASIQLSASRAVFIYSICFEDVVSLTAKTVAAKERPLPWT
jgi:hypothetical protein